MQPLPQLGSPSFVPRLLQYLVAQESLQGWTPDPTLFSAVLLTLIVNRGGLVVDVARDGEGSKARRRGMGNVVQAVIATMQGVFGRTAGYVHVDRNSTPESVSRSILSSTSSAQQAGARSKSAQSSRYASAVSLPVDTPGTSRQTSFSRDDEAATVDPTIPDVLVITGLEDTTSPVMIKLVDILVKRRVALDAVGGERQLKDDFLVVWVRDEMCGDIPGWIIDQFATSTLVYGADIQPLAESLLVTPLIPPEYISDIASLLAYTHIHPPLQIHISNLLSAVTGHPRLHSTITGRVLRLFPSFVRAHRLLSAPFDLPLGWKDHLLALQARQVNGEDDKFGVGGGKGGVNTWAKLAGEEPDLAELGGDESMEEWYAQPKNVEAVWNLCMRHRVKARKQKGEVMWLIKGGAGDGRDEDSRYSETARRDEVERILAEIPRVV